ncbi:Uncharacterized protein SCF082_LOCUS27048 [Durusdinium trenchii]|uniref:Uncharacterized protein n=1 Tax=Durusdinium trenchii TaxID=1381693 RepID=A0ABP0MBS3_9DINO
MMKLSMRLTLAEAIEEYGKGYSTRRPSAFRSSASQTRSHQSAAAPHQEDEEPGFHSPRESNPARHDAELGETTDGAQQEELQWHRPQWWSNDGWWDQPYSYHYWNDQRSWEKGNAHYMTSENIYQADVSDHASVEAEKFLPDFVVAWMLLQRSGLDGSERATIIASLRNHFTTEKVKEALKLNWTEEDLRKRDQTRGSTLIAEDYEEDDAFLHEGMPPPAPTWMTEEEIEEYNYLTQESEEALAAIQGARRTLRDAREKQSMMRKSRQFYPMKRVENRKNDLRSEVQAIIDPGATSTVGSVDALTHINDINAGQGRSRDIQVDPSERPSFRFGNNGRTVCLSTAQLPVPLHGGMSTMKVHVHDIPNQPPFS